MSIARTIFVVDDDPDMCSSLKVLLEAHDFIVRDFSSAKAFLAERSHAGGCLIVDVRMPEMGGLELQDEIVRRGIELPVIVITGHASVPLAIRAMRAGAIDFLEKPFGDDELLVSVRMALDASRHARNSVQEARAATEVIDRLTPRERQVFEQLVAGKTNKLAAYELSISPRTIEIHRARIMDKLKARNLSDLVRTALAASVAPRISS